MEKASALVVHWKCSKERATAAAIELIWGSFLFVLGLMKHIAWVFPFVSNLLFNDDVKVISKRMKIRAKFLMLIIAANSAYHLQIGFINCISFICRNHWDYCPCWMRSQLFRMARIWPLQTSLSSISILILISEENEEKPFLSVTMQGRYSPCH